MTRYPMGEARKNLTELVARVAYAGERISICRRNKPMAVLVSPQDAEVLRAIEDREDLAVAREVLRRIEAGEEETYSWDEVKRGERARAETP